MDAEKNRKKMKRIQQQNAESERKLRKRRTSAKIK